MGVHEELVAVVQPPSGYTTRFAEWGELECRLGARVPEDYRWLVETYGPGVFDEFLHVMQPKSRFPAIRLVSFSQSYRQRLSSLQALGRPLPCGMHELLPVARTEDGDVISWVMRPGGDSSRWTLVVQNSSRTKWDSFAGGILEFIAAVYLRNFRLPSFPDDFPSGAPNFQQYPTVEEAQALLHNLMQHPE